MNQLSPIVKPSYHMTPQYRKNPKTYQIQRLAQRISLIKHQIQLHKDQNTYDHLHLQQMNSLNQSFQTKLSQELNKCQELKEVQLKTHKNQVQSLPDPATYIETFLPNQNLYNSDALNSNQELNTQFKSELTTSKSFSENDSEEALKKTTKEKERKVSSQRTIKKVVNSGSKNTIKQKNKEKYLKETLLTSIMLVIFALVLHQILSFL